jgi:teichuronic acid biosynthesis glycosyltransferase TuaG
MMRGGRGKVSIIMPAYNAAATIEPSVLSVIEQSWENWELLIINDGSTDNTSEIVGREYLSDNRIKYFCQKNKGVSAARNMGLKQATGEYICFLDADDVLPPKSLENRLRIFDEYSEVDFVDGKVIFKDERLKETLGIYLPSFKGDPFSRLIKLDSSCFFGNTWMIKRSAVIGTSFNTSLTHCEDLLFYISIARSKIYSYTNEPVLIYRRTGKTAMTNLKGLQEGYRKLYHEIKALKQVHSLDVLYYKIKVSKIIFLSYLFDGRKPVKAFQSLWTNLWM